MATRCSVHAKVYTDYLQESKCSHVATLITYANVIIRLNLTDIIILPM